VWSEPSVLDTVADAQPREPQLIALGGDTLLDVWARGTDDRPRAMQLRAGSDHVALVAARSPDGGRTWEPAGELPLSGGLSGLRVARDRAGDVHAVYVGAPSDLVLGAPGRLKDARWRGGAWHQPMAVAPRPVFGRPLLTPGPHGLTLLWSEEELSDGQLLPRGFAAWLDAPGCEPEGRCRPGPRASAPNALREERESISGVSSNGPPWQSDHPAAFLLLTFPPSRGPGWCCRWNRQ
jgi:hypothetical protein